MDRLYHWKSGEPVVKFHAPCAQGFLHPGGILTFLIGLIMHLSRGLIEAIQSFEK
jgi:hypothetical protein